MKLLIYVYSLALALLIPQLTFGQLTDKVTDEKPNLLTKVVKRGGWEIPDLNNAKIFSEKKFVIDGMEVTVKNYKLIGKKLLLNIENYWLEHNNTLLISPSKYGCEANRVFSYIVKDRVFAHRVNCVVFTMEETTKTTMNGRKRYAATRKSYFRATIVSLYFDEDDDGKFETKYTLSEMPSELPKWVKDLAAN